MSNSVKSGSGHKKPCSKDCSAAQKVVIPKGMINPEETTVIEIPCSLHKQPVVVAKRKTQGHDCSEQENGGTTSLVCKTIKQVPESNSFYSAKMDPEELDFTIPTTGNETSIFSPNFNSTALEQGSKLASPDMNNMVEVDTHCGGGNLKRNSIRGCPGPRRSNTTRPAGSCASESQNPMQELANNLQGDPNLSLDETEQQERAQLRQDLEAFQKARRQLIERTTKFANQLPTGDMFESYSTRNSGGFSPTKSKNTMIDPRFDQKEYARQLYNTIL